jgi:hypothetical protein
MGYKITRQSNNFAHDTYELVVDTPKDLEELPNYIGAGSTAVVLKGTGGTLEVRMKALSGDWVII